MAYLRRFTPQFRRMLAIGIVGLTCGATTGCAAANKEALSAKIQLLERDINGLRADNLILKDRMEMLEEQRSEHRGSRAASVEEVPSTPSDRPTLKVVRLAPSEPSAPANEARPSAVDTGPKAVIVGDARGVTQQPAGSTAVRATPYKRR